jgi:hypothetical protein
VSVFRKDAVSYAVFSNSTAKVRGILRDASVKFSQPLKPQVSNEQPSNSAGLSSAQMCESVDLIDEDIQEYERFTGFRVIESTTRNSSSGFDDLEFNEDSLLLLKGAKTVHKLVDLILNLPIQTEMNWVTSSIFSTVPFIFGRAFPLKFKSRKVTRASSYNFGNLGDLRTEYLVDLTGPVLPSVYNQIKSIMQTLHSGEFTIKAWKASSISESLVKRDG